MSRALVYLVGLSGLLNVVCSYNDSGSAIGCKLSQMLPYSSERRRKEWVVYKIVAVI